MEFIIINLPLFLVELLSVRGLLWAVQSLPPLAPPEAEAVRDVLGDCGEEEDQLAGYRHDSDTQPAPRRRYVARGCKLPNTTLSFRLLIWYLHCSNSVKCKISGPKLTASSNEEWKRLMWSESSRTAYRNSKQRISLFETCAIRQIMMMVGRWKLLPYFYENVN